MTLIIALIIIMSSTAVMLLADKRLRKKIMMENSNKNFCRSKNVRVKGIKVSYIEVGEGFPTVLIHGFMSSAVDFTEIIDALSQKYKIFAIDIIGFGESDKNPELNFSKRNMAEVIYEFMSFKGYDKYNVLGHSMGGGISLNLVAYHPESVNSLILVDSVGYINSKRPPIPVFILEHVFKAYCIQRIFYRFCFFNKNRIEEEKFNRIYNLNCRIPGKTLYNFSRHDDSDTIEGNVKGIKCQVLIIWGRHDKVTPLESGYRFSKDIPESTLVIFENSGHLPYVEEEEKFIATVDKFINSNISSPEV